MGGLISRVSDRMAGTVEPAGTLGTRVWAMLKDDIRLTTKGPILSLTQWYSWVDAHAHWRELYRTRLVLMLT